MLPDECKQLEQARTLLKKLLDVLEDEGKPEPFKVGYALSITEGVIGLLEACQEC